MNIHKIKNIHYPKRKKLPDINQVVFDIPEPERRSLLDFLEENLVLARRKTYVHRMMYLGEHDYKAIERLEDIFSSTITEVNKDSKEELTGFLLCYKQYFVHVLEGDEDSIHRQIKLFLEKHKFQHQVGNVKILIEVEHVLQRLTKGWKSFYAVPPKLMGKMSTTCSAQEAGRQLYFCVRKLYNLINQINYDGSTTQVSSVLNPGDQTRSTVASTTTSLSMVSASPSPRKSSAMSIMSTEKPIKDRHRSNLPEVDVLRFILNYPYTESLQKYSSRYMGIDHGYIYNELIWPAPPSMIPYDVFDLPYSTIIELPKQITRNMVMKQAEESDGEMSISDENIDTDKSGDGTA